MAKDHILIVGGAGFIGSHVAKMLDRRGYQPIIFDNLSTGHRETVKGFPLIVGDLAHLHELDQVFHRYKFSAVMHFAALIDVGESVTDPLKYNRHNVGFTLNLIQAMKNHGVSTLIFSSSASIFGMPMKPHIDEEHPCLPINPYGHTKLTVEKILRDCDAAYGIKSCCLRYFNAAGGDPEGIIKNHKKKETHLIPLALQSLKNPAHPLTIYGTDYPTHDGTCIRDYIHLEDLGTAHILAMEQLFNCRQSTQYNLGNGNGFSVRDVVNAAEEVLGMKVPVQEGPRRQGDPPRLVADAQKAQRDLGWKPRYPLLQRMIEDAWRAMQH